MEKRHTVKQGEHLPKIAESYGFRDYRTIWDHPNNALLKQKRQNPMVLFPGDELFIPDKDGKKVSCATGQRHRFKVSRQALMLQIVIKDFDNQPVANTACELELEGAVYKLNTDGQGMIKREIPKTAEKGKLVVPDLGLEIPIKIGHLDPLDEGPGWRARLINLGYYIGPPGEEDEPGIRYAIEEFQCDHGLKVTGTLDDATKAKLKGVHGC